MLLVTCGHISVRYSGSGLSEAQLPRVDIFPSCSNFGGLSSLPLRLRTTRSVQRRAVSEKMRIILLLFADQEFGLKIARKVNVKLAVCLATQLRKG